MKHFHCSNCNERVFFSSSLCLHCGSTIGFDPQKMEMLAFLLPDHQPRSYCANANHDACNWLAPLDHPSTYCIACELNKTIPNLSSPQRLNAWQLLERAKKILIYSLLRFGLPFGPAKLGDADLKFDFAEGKMTGFLDNIITINISETDSVERERQRQYFDEPYRTLLGHLRHESGHFYWKVLVENSPELETFRNLFGNERQDYAAALTRHHEHGPIDGWQSNCVSAYASVHPWEDWAETWAHYMHMVDAVETAEYEGMEPRSASMNFGMAWPYRRYDVYREESFAGLKARWVPLTIALNTINRSIGHEDFYPFVTPEPAYEKLAFVHRLIREYGSNS
jgi:hypothetical protein